MDGSCMDTSRRNATQRMKNASVCGDPKRSLLRSPWRLPLSPDQEILSSQQNLEAKVKV